MPSRYPAICCADKDDLTEKEKVEILKQAHINPIGGASGNKSYTGQGEIV